MDLGYLLQNELTIYYLWTTGIVTKIIHLRCFQFFDILMLVENTSVICIQIGARFWWLGRSFTYNRKRSGPRIEPCGTLYFNVCLRKKIININQKFSVWEIGLKPFNYRRPETRIFYFLQGELYGLKYQPLSEDLLIPCRYASGYPYQLKKVYQLSLTKVCYFGY